MSSVRQSELFAGEDWTVLYRAFTQINFNASDPPSINKALTAYIQQNYPEDFNDWIEQSEFVMLLDLLSWLAGTLAFKTDINARENFLGAAEARESILRLARFLSYNPRRNQPARGLLKIEEVSTDDDVIDSYGANLNGVSVQWNNPDDPDWQEHFTLIMNNAFLPNNQYGQPIKSGTVGGVRTQGYTVNNTLASPLRFTATAAGTAMTFEVCNGDFDDGGSFSEIAPDYNAAFNLYYRNDSKGNDSSGTGFFMLFKQGQLSNQTYNIPTPQENQVIDINITGINDSDVWVQTVDDSGSVTTNWTKVPAIFSENITFNSIPSSVRNIFSVVTQDSDKVSIRFSDGRFGAAPVGNTRIWYRTSNGLNYQIRPQDIDRVRLPIPYVNAQGVAHTLFVTFSLAETVSNSAPRETDDQIRLRAPSVYGSQNRMVSGEDYNTFPLQQNIAVKMKAVNRVYSGHSRYIDLNDPTATYQDVNIFSDDGIFYQERRDTTIDVPTSLNRTPAEIVANYIQIAINRQQTSNYVQSLLLSNIYLEPTGATWTQSTAAKFSSTGYFSGVGSGTQFVPGASLFVKTPAGSQMWVSIASISGSIIVAPATGAPGPVTLAEPIPTGSTIVSVLPPFYPTLGADVVVGAQNNVANNQSFTLSYDYSQQAWTLGPAINSTTPMINGTSVLVSTADYLSGGMWRIGAFGIIYIFSSLNSVQWYFEGDKAVDAQSGKVEQDYIRIMKSNTDLSSTGYDSSMNLRNIGMQKDYNIAVDKLIQYSDGYTDPRCVEVKFIDADEDGQPDDPDTGIRIGVSSLAQHIFFVLNSATSLYDPFYSTVVFEQESDRMAANVPQGTIAYQLNGVTTATSNTFWSYGSAGWSMVFTTYKHCLGRGPNVAATWYGAGLVAKTVPTGDQLSFQWKHYATTEHRIDPSKTNIIDIFVLTTEFDYLVRQWIANGCVPADQPLPPSELDLRLAFATFEDYKMFSDEIVWRPASYKYLFGVGADPELQAQFKIVKLANAPLSDGEIRSRVIKAVNDYFNVSLWDFGATFYFSELSAYIHQQLATNVASVVIVPTSSDGSFGDIYEVTCRSNEIFVSSAQVSDVIIITSNTAANLRIR